MAVTENKIKKVLFCGIMFVLCIPIVQMKFDVFKVKELAGSYTRSEKSWFNIKNWFSQEYQVKNDKWLNENIGFRPFFVRLRNQVYWDLCHQSRTEHVVIGKDDYLYDWNYINAWNGADYKGEEHYKNVCSRLRVLQDSLARKNVLLLVALAPGKASYCWENIPEADWKHEGEKNNYKSISAQLKNNGVNTIDFYKWFLQMKPKTVFPLYSKGGIHWSNYGCWLAMDSLLKYFEKTTGSDFVSMKMKNVQLADSIMGPDNDVGESLNLLWPPEPTKMAYPQLEWENSAGKLRPDLYVVSDSYFWQMYSNGFSEKVFDCVDFSFYNREVYTSKKEKFWLAEPLEKFPFDAGKYKILLFMSTEANLKDFPWGFTEMAEKAVYNK